MKGARMVGGVGHQDKLLISYEYKNIHLIFQTKSEKRKEDGDEVIKARAG